MTDATEFIELLKNLHSSYATDPQRAVISDDRVIYSFLLRGPVEVDTGRQYYFTGLSPQRHIEDIVRGFASALKVLHPNLSIRTLPARGTKEIKIVYEPKTKQELDEIVKYLRTVPLEDALFLQKMIPSFVMINFSQKPLHFYTIILIKL